MTPNNNNSDKNKKDDDKSLLSQGMSYADQQWQRAAGMLQTNPSLVTYHILCMALKHRPPVDIVQFMLKLNPKAASVPKSGPTALQVAVQHGCSIPVIRMLIEACPFALVATNPGSYLDPLSYAKRFRSSDKELVKLLSLPLRHWVGDDNNSMPANMERPPNYSYKSPPPPEPTAAAAAKEPFSNIFKTPQKSTTSSGAIPVTPISGLPKHQSKSNSMLSLMDRQELDNVKTLCLSVVKGHKRLSRELKGLSETWPRLQEQLADQLDQQFRTQLIALDMKEKAMKAQIRRMERRMQRKIQKQEESKQEQQEERWQEWVRFYDKRLRRLYDRLVETEQNVENKVGGLEMHLENQIVGGHGRRGAPPIQECRHRPLLPYNTDNNNNTDTSSTSSSTNNTNTTTKIVALQNKPTPIVFCSPVMTPVTLDDDSEVRSLLSEDDVLVEKRRLLPMRWMNLCKTRNIVWPFL